jgi:hypothetical protein
MSHCPSKTERRQHTTTTTTTHEVGQIGAWSVRRDEDLLVEYAEKQTQDAFEELVHRYERELYSYHLLGWLAIVVTARITKKPLRPAKRSLTSP